jgi:ribosome-binding factor A
MYEKQTDLLFLTCLDPYRNERLAESLREELEELIGYELSDPRIGSATVSHVYLSLDHRHAHVHLALKGTEDEQKATLEALAHARQFLRHQITERLRMFRTPELQFEADLPTALAAKAPQLLKRIRRGRVKD